MPPDPQPLVRRRRSVVKRAPKAAKEPKPAKNPKPKAVSEATAESTTKAKAKPRKNPTPRRRRGTTQKRRRGRDGGDEEKENNNDEAGVSGDDCGASPAFVFVFTRRLTIAHRVRAASACPRPRHPSSPAYHYSRLRLFGLVRPVALYSAAVFILLLLLAAPMSSTAPGFVRCVRVRVDARCVRTSVDLCLIQRGTISFSHLDLGRVIFSSRSWAGVLLLGGYTSSSSAGICWTGTHAASYIQSALPRAFPFKFFFLLCPALFSVPLSFPYVALVRYDWLLASAGMSDLSLTAARHNIMASLSLSSFHFTVICAGRVEISARPWITLTQRQRPASMGVGVAGLALVCHTPPLSFPVLLHYWRARAARPSAVRDGWLVLGMWDKALELMDTDGCTSRRLCRVLAHTGPEPQVVRVLCAVSPPLSFILPSLLYIL
ncbi:hypothetical protein K438DRAFT_2013815 [Mycena galopus ATCC 62051]|nr:hypothetical protein K438DRAFT_2013815 [Mycena galopus ATCC 62051]